MSVLLELCEEAKRIDFGDPEAVARIAISTEAELLDSEAILTEDPYTSLGLGETAVRAMNSVYEAFETNLENEFAMRVIEGTATVEDYPLYERFRRLLTKEVDSAKISSNSRVLFIGSGPFPITAILLNELSGGAKIDCFDMSAEAIATSTKLLAKLGFGGNIKVRPLVAQNASLPTISEAGDLGGHDIVLVALLAQPKDQILDRLWRSVGPYGRIILRSSEGNRRLLYSGMDPITDKYRYMQLAEYHAGVGDTISGIVLKTAHQPSIFRI